MGLKSGLTGGIVAGAGLLVAVCLIALVLLEIAVKAGIILAALLVLWFVLSLFGLLPPPPLETAHTMGAPA